MEYVVTISGFLGAWLLVGGPIYQAALELKEQEIDREAIDATTHDIPKPPPISAWWWLLPPVAYVLNARRNEKHRQAVFAAMKPEHIKQTVVFLDKARGWFIVAGGAFFIAVKETWELIHLLDWHVATFWVLVVILPFAAVAYTAISLSRSQKMLAATEGVVDA
ncbi:MAG: hypothetical protein V4479_01710 [Actinomycetota bacterium]